MIKKVVKCMSIFIAIILLCTILLTITAKIPRQWIQEKCKESASMLYQRTEVTYSKKYDPYTYLHPYADAMLLNIVYCIDTQNPLTSVLQANYYKDSGEELTKVVNENKEANTQYIRYWHGSMVIIRPLLIFFNIQQIYVINAVILISLAVILCLILWKKNHKLLTIGFIIATIMTGSFGVPWCLEYTWTYLLMLIASIIAICIEKKGDNKLYLLFLITGMLTCFFDFLTTETLTILVPLLLVLGIRYQENRIQNSKEEIKMIILCIGLWGVGYFGMWCAKWIIASIVLNINAWTLVKDNLMLRVNGQVEGLPLTVMYQEVIPKNLLALYPLNKVIRPMYLIFLPIFFIIFILLFKQKDKDKLKYLIPIALLGLLPYIRYLALANHSYRHFFFTFRAQFSAIIAFIIAFVYCLDKEKLFYKIERKKKKEKEEK